MFSPILVKAITCKESKLIFCVFGGAFCVIFTCSEGSTTEFSQADGPGRDIQVPLLSRQSLSGLLLLKCMKQKPLSEKERNAETELELSEKLKYI